MISKLTRASCALVILASAAWAARCPILGGPGLIHLQSAKIGPKYGYRTVNLLTYYGDLHYLQDQRLPGASCIDGWTHHLVSYSPYPDVAVLAALTGHGNKWSLAAQPSQPVDQILGNAGDAVLSVKYHRALLGGKLELGAEPVLSIPLGKKGEYANGTPIVNDCASNTGRFDFGGKLLADYNLDRAVIMANAGIITRGEQRSQMPLGAGIEYSINQKLTGFFEASGELRSGSAAADVPDSLVPRGMGYDRTEFRIGAGARLMPMGLVQVTVAANLGLTKATAPWQIILGLDLPAAAGRNFGGAILGAIAGLIKDRDSNVPMKGMITFPGAEIPGTVSDELGNYIHQLPPGEYRIHIYANGYRWIERKITVEAGKKLRWDLTLKRKQGTVSGKVLDARTASPLRATIRFAGASLPEIAADSLSGGFTATLPAGKYTMTVAAEGYQPRELVFPLKDKQELEQQVLLEPVAAPKAAVAPARPALPVLPDVKPAAVVKHTPAEIESLYKAGVEQFMNEEYDKAQRTFQKILKSDPGNAKAREYLDKTRDRLKKIKG